jgi:hypothetical protein
MDDDAATVRRITASHGSEALAYSSGTMRAADGPSAPRRSARAQPSADRPGAPGDTIDVLAEAVRALSPRFDARTGNAVAIAGEATFASAGAR